MSRIITTKDKKLLNSLKGQADLLQRKLDEVVEKANYITGEDDESGFTFDFILNDFGTLDELLARLEIRVSDEVAEGVFGEPVRQK